MRLIFIGADHEVTGSCHVLEVCGRYILVDCGMEQGTDDFETAELPMNIADIDYVLLTHAHIDHSGMLPLLYARGFRGDVIATPATGFMRYNVKRFGAYPDDRSRMEEQKRTKSR